jgi:formylmethanofuran:tetrahydromethanopterin formyltransferase
MSRVIDEFSFTKPEVAELTKGIETYVCSELKNIAKEMGLTGEEIRQLYQSVMDSINANGMEEAMRWGIEERRIQRESKED